MNSKKILFCLLTITLSVTSLTSIKQAGALEQLNPQMAKQVNLKSDSTSLMLAQGKKKSQGGYTTNQSLSQSVKLVTLSSGIDQSGARFGSNNAVADLSKFGFNDRAGSVAVNDGRVWRFYRDKNFKGPFIEVGPDEGRGVGKLNRQISSFRPVN